MEIYTKKKDFTLFKNNNPLTVEQTEYLKNCLNTNEECLLQAAALVRELSKENTDLRNRIKRISRGAIEASKSIIENNEQTRKLQAQTRKIQAQTRNLQTFLIVYILALTTLALIATHKKFGTLNAMHIYKQVFPRNIPQ